jgi:hypothetical protein
VEKVQAVCHGRREARQSMITGAQIKAARELLGWSRFQLAQRAKLHPAIVERGEEATGAVHITAYQLGCFETRSKSLASRSRTATRPA